MRKYILPLLAFSLFLHPSKNIEGTEKEETKYKTAISVDNEAIKKLPKKAVADLKWVQNNTPILDHINSLSKFERNEILCLALNIYHEARGSSTEDQKGVALVSINRKDASYADTVCGVVYQTKGSAQFSWTANDDRSIKRKQEEVNAWTKAQQTAFNIYMDPNVEDHTKGALHYISNKKFFSAKGKPLKNTPQWAKHPVEKNLIGQHMYLHLTSDATIEKQNVAKREAVASR